MIWQGWLFTGATAVLVTMRATQDYPRREDVRPIVYGSIGFLASLLFAYQSLYVVRLDQGAEFTTQYPAMAVFGVAVAVVNAYIVISGPLEVTRELLSEREVT